MSPFDAVSGLADRLNAALPDPAARVAVVAVDADHPPLLSPAERERAAGFRFLKRQREWTGGRIAAKLALIEAGTEPRSPAGQDLTVATGPAGEPVVTAVRGEHRMSMGVSIAHAGGLAAAVAFPLARPIGLDLEPIAEIDPELAGLACTPRERLLLEQRAAGADRTEALLRIWTSKEAAVKLTRTGLGVSLSQVQVEPMDPDLTELEVTLPSSVHGAPVSCRVRVIPVPNWIAALAWFPPWWATPTARHFEGEEPRRTRGGSGRRVQWSVVRGMSEGWARRRITFDHPGCEVRLRTIGERPWANPAYQSSTRRARNVIQRFGAPTAPARSS